MRHTTLFALFALFALMACSSSDTELYLPEGSFSGWTEEVLQDTCGIFENEMGQAGLADAVIIASEGEYTIAIDNTGPLGRHIPTFNCRQPREEAITCDTISYEEDLEIAILYDEHTLAVNVADRYITLEYGWSADCDRCIESYEPCDAKVLWTLGS